MRIVALLLSVLSACAPGLVIEPLGESESAALVAAWRAARRTPGAVSGEVSIAAASNLGSRRVDAAVRIGNPDRFVAELSSPRGTEAVLFCDGTVYGEWLVGENRARLFSARGLIAGAAVPLPAPPAELAALLLGRVPERPDDVVTAGRARDGRPAVRIVGGVQAHGPPARDIRVLLDDRLDPVRLEWLAAGRRTLRVDFGRALEIDGYRVPGRVAVESPSHGATLVAVWREPPTVEPDAPPAAEFAPELPATVVVERVP